MDDLIKRQDAITAYCEHECGIKGMTRENCGATDCGTIFDDIPSAQPEPITVNIDHELTQEEYEKLRKDMANAPIMLLPSAQQWIPCSERLPEEYVDVLVWFEYYRFGGYNRMYSTYGIGDYDAEYDKWWINHESGWRDLHVFAWMQLPEPYKGEES